MNPSGPFESIDWQQPWLAPYRAMGAALCAEPDRLAALNRRATLADLHNHAGLPLRFVPQSALPPEVAYEAYIGATGCVPTRDNLHDFFNGLAWLTYPRVKAELNRLQASHIEQRGIGKSRGPARDAATIFDENAALLICRDPALASALRAHDWQEVFLTRRAEFLRDTEIRLFGHALLEKLTAPYKAITAHAWVVRVDDAFFALGDDARTEWIDQSIASMLSGYGFTTADFTPLPVLGVPGWWGGQDQAFYADAAVFRVRRNRPP